VNERGVYAPEERVQREQKRQERKNREEEDGAARSGKMPLD
jgi:hypothetical protein